MSQNTSQWESWAYFKTGNEKNCQNKTLNNSENKGRMVHAQIFPVVICRGGKSIHRIAKEFEDINFILR